MSENDYVAFMQYFKIGIVVFIDYKNTIEHFENKKNFLSDYNFYVTKRKCIFEYFDYIMILDYFENIHYNIFYNQQSPEVIYSIKACKKEILFIKCVIKRIWNICLAKKITIQVIQEVGKLFSN